FVAAAQKIAERNAQLAAESTALAKAIEEKQAAVIQSEVQLVLKHQSLDTSRAKLAPLAEAIRAADEAMAAARQKLHDDASAVAGLENSVKAFERFSEFIAARDAAITADQAMAAAQAQLASAQQAMQTSTVGVAEAEAAVAAAKQALVEAMQKRVAAEEQTNKRNAVADALVAAAG